MIILRQLEVCVTFSFAREKSTSRSSAFETVGHNDTRVGHNICEQAQQRADQVQVDEMPVFAYSDQSRR